MIFRLVLLGLALAATPAAAQEFDHYVLALSWSPTFCATEAGARENLQCDADADHTFVVHGLWPSGEGESLTECGARARPSRAEIDDVLDIMPSRGLVQHQWRRHGTCSGLSPAEYLAEVRAAYERVTVPPGLAQIAHDTDISPAVIAEAFLRANPGLTEGGIALRCEDGRLDEVRICLTPELAFTTCRAGGAESCRARLVDVPAPE